MRTLSVRIDLYAGGMTDDEPITVLPANEAAWQDLKDIFGDRGPGHRCQCQWYKLRPGETFGRQRVEERAARLREQTNAGTPQAGTSGLIGYAGQVPVGWCSVEPRSHYEGLLRVYKVPWEGRHEDKGDDTVWAVTCLFVRAGYRRRGVSRALAAAAVDRGRLCGASALEAYPIDPEGVISEELHVGTRSVFAGAGLTEVHQPTRRRRVMRINFRGAEREDR